MIVCVFLCVFFENDFLRAISGIVHAYHSCDGKREKLFRSGLSTISKFASVQFLDKLTSDGFSGQNKVTKTCQKYLLARCYK